MNKTKILVIRIRRVGDAILSESVCKSLKASIPNSEIHYLVYDFIGDLFETDPNIDKVIRINKNECHNIFKYIRKVWKIVRNEKYDIIIDLRSTMSTLPFAVFSPGSKYRIGLKKSYNRFFLNKRIDYIPDTDYINQKLSLLKPLEQEFNISHQKDFSIYLKKEEINLFRERMVEAGLNFENPIILATVTTRVTSKRWPLSYMEECIRRAIATYPNLQIIFNFSGDEEKEDAVAMYNNLGQPKQIFIHVEAKGLRELASLISNCDFFFGNEGGPRHLAQALDVPSIAYFSPGSPYKRWLPEASERFQALSHENILSLEESKDMEYELLIKSVTPDMVWKRLDPLLAKIVDIKSSNKE